MKVTLLAHTQFAFFGAEKVDQLFDDLDWGPTDRDSDGDALTEFAGRACYQSWNRPNPKTATNEGYLKNILDQKHESVLEHASATFYVEGVSRSLTHELIRHRHLSYSELSQRYVDMEEAEIVVPPLLRDLNTLESDAFATFYGTTYSDKQAYELLVEQLVDETDGAKRKQIREAARAIMPNATETKIVVTGNMRAWRDMLKKRWHVAADAEIREFAGEILRQLRKIAPNSFQDIPEEPYE